MEQQQSRQTSGEAHVAAQDQQYLTFLLRGETFAMGIRAIKEIIEYGNVTPVPMMPPFIRGVINLRGTVVPVVDLSARFGRGATELGRRACIVIVEAHEEQGRQYVGVLVDAVSAVLEIPASEIEPPPTFGAHIRTELIAGMGKLDGKFVIILDVARVVAADDLGLGELAPRAPATS